MKARMLLLIALVMLFLKHPAGAAAFQRIGHTTLTPRHTSPDDKGMYGAVIDPTNGYAYFFGNYLFKLDITGNLPVQVGPSIQTGQFGEGTIDPAAGYAYMPKVGGTIYRYSLGAGTNAVSAAGSLLLAEGGTPVNSLVVDDSDPNPANHYGYVMCPGTPSKVVKVALGTFTEVATLTLTNNNTAYAWGKIDKQNGYAYFASYATYIAPVVPQILKIKLTPGNNAPILVGTNNLGATPVPLWTASIDTVHGYVYYSTDNGTTNIPETLFKVKLGAGDALPTPVPFGGVSLRTNEVQIISNVADPVGGYVYLGDDNTYPGRIYQFAMNGSNAPIEMGYLQLQGGTSVTNPPNGVTSSNTTTNSDGVLPFGEVMLRSGVFDPVRGFAYFGQDSRPNQVVKVQVERDVPTVTGTTKQPGGAFQCNFTFTPGFTCSALATTNVSLPLSSWTLAGSCVETSPGQFQFTDPQAGSFTNRFYRIRSP